MLFRVTLLRLMARLLTATSWRTPALVLATVFLTSWAAMALVEPGNELAQPETYWWWFLITASTVGYGDYYPETTSGQVVGAYVVVGGVITLTTIFTFLTSVITTLRGRRMQGTIDLDVSGHLALLGYAPGRTRRLVDDLLTDGAGHVVVCAWDDQIEAHPMSGEERVSFVRGDLTDLATLSRACLADAAAILVDARDDNEAVTLIVAAEEAAPGVHTVVALRDLARSRTIGRIDETVRCVQWHSLQMVREELQDPGISTVYEELSSPGGASTWSAQVPAELGGREFGDWQTAFGRRYGAMILGLRHDGHSTVSPAWDTPVPAGAQLFYVCHRRLPAEELVSLVG